jgi:hypothetical protein
MRDRHLAGIVDHEGGGFSPTLRWVGGGSGTWRKRTRTVRGVELKARMRCGRRGVYADDA